MNIGPKLRLRSTVGPSRHGARQDDSDRRPLGGGACLRLSTFCPGPVAECRRPERFVVRDERTDVGPEAFRSDPCKLTMICGRSPVGR